MSLETWIISTRPWSLVMTFISACIAGILAYGEGSFNIPIFLLTMLGLMIAHISANMTNDYYDVIHGVDEKAPTSLYRPHPLLKGEIDRKKYMKAIFLLYSLGISISLFLTWLYGYPVLIYSILGVLLGIFYTADPVMLKHRSIGEISVFLAFGPLMVGGTYYVLTQKISIEPMMVSIPIGLLVALVLLANNLRDREFDASVGINTITTNRSLAEGVSYYKLLLVSAYLSIPILIYLGLLSFFSFVVFVTIHEAINIVKSFSIKIPLNSDQVTSQLALHFGLLLVIGEFINIIFNSLK